jgi:hypothetical protein
MFQVSYIFMGTKSLTPARHWQARHVSNLCVQQPAATQTDAHVLQVFLVRFWWHQSCQQRQCSFRNITAVSKKRWTLC